MKFMHKPLTFIHLGKLDVFPYSRPHGRVTLNSERSLILYSASNVADRGNFKDSNRIFQPFISIPLNYRFNIFPSPIERKQNLHIPLPNLVSREWWFRLTCIERIGGKELASLSKLYGNFSKFYGGLYPTFKDYAH